MERRRTDGSLSVLRIYLRRRSTHGPSGFRGWLKRKPISRYLVEQALSMGVLYGTVTLGHLGYVHGARSVAETTPETSLAVLPTCVELVGDREVLDAYVDALGHELSDAVLVFFDGVALSLSMLEQR